MDVDADYENSTIKIAYIYDTSSSANYANGYTIEDFDKPCTVEILSLQVTTSDSSGDTMYAIVKTEEFNSVHVVTSFAPLGPVASMLNGNEDNVLAYGIVSNKITAYDVGTRKVARFKVGDRLSSTFRIENSGKTVHMLIAYRVYY